METSTAVQASAILANVSLTLVAPVSMANVDRTLLETRPVLEPSSGPVVPSLDTVGTRRSIVESATAIPAHVYKRFVAGRRLLLVWG